MTLNVTEAKRALIEKPMLATSMERVEILCELKNAHIDKPQPIRLGLILAELLSRVSVPLESYDLFAGRVANEVPSPEKEQIFQDFIRDGENLYRTVIFGTGHCTLCWEELVKLGFTGLSERARARLEGVTDPEKRDFLRGIILVYDAMIAFANRYADKADKMGMTELSGCLRAVATRAPQSFYEALQICWLVAFVDCAYLTDNPTLTLGRLDQILYPYYAADVKSGVLTEDKARAYITDYYCKHNLMMGRGEHQVGDESNSTTFERILNFDAPQYLLLAGTDERGVGAVNELTELFAECIVPEFKNPVAVVRYYKGMNESEPKLWKTLCDKARSSASMMIYNDDNVIAAMQRIGVSENMARGYEHFGCNWASPGVGSAWINMGPPASKRCALSDEDKALLCREYDRCDSACGWPQEFVDRLCELEKEGALPVSIDEAYDVFFARFEKYLKKRFTRLTREIGIRLQYPSKLLVFGDCFYPLPVERAMSHASGGSDVYFEEQSIQGLGTMIDSFIVLDKLVYTDKKVSLPELLAAVRADFVGYEGLLTTIRKLDKWGSNTEHSNAHAVRFVTRFADCIRRENELHLKKDKIVLLPALQSDTWHLKYGEKAGATIDGRRAHTPYSQNSKPSDGSCNRGITAMLASLAALPLDRFTSGALNLDVQPKDFEGEEGLANLCALIGTYMNMGGLQVQVSSVDPAVLRDAQAHPENHGDIRVRVTGYSGVFVDISKRLQDDIINRMS